MKPKAVLLCCLIFSFALNAFAQTKAEGGSPVPVAGWSVSYTLMSTTTTTARQLVFISYSNGTGSFRLIGPRTTWTPTMLFPAVWDRVTNNFISFSSEVEFPVGNCCRETGTLIFKGNTSQTGVISGAAIFVTNVPSTTTTGPYVIRTGTFIATPIPIVASP